MLSSNPVGSPSGPGGAERREQVGEHPEEDDAADPAHGAVAPPSQRQDRPREGGERDQRPEPAEGAVEAGEEVVAPDAGVGRIVGDVEVGPGALQALGVEQVFSPQMADPGNWVAGGEQVAEVPEAATEQCRDEPPGPGGAAPAGRGEGDDGDRSSAPASASTVTLVPAASPTARPAKASGQPTGSESLPPPSPRAPPRAF